VSAYIARRLVTFIPVLLLLSFAVFLLIHLTPGDPLAMIFMGAGFADPKKLMELRHQMGLDLPLPVQYARWLWSTLHGDLGYSIRTQQAVGQAILERLPVTLELSTFAMIFSTVVTVGVGLASGLWPSRWLNTLTTGIVLGGVAVPPFTLGILLILIFAQWLTWLPPAGYVPLRQNVIESLRFMILPTVTLGIGLALVARMTQVTLTDVLRCEYILTAQAKGLPKRLVVLRHALKNALIPIITVVSLESGTLLGGVVLTEVVFAIPGLGQFVAENILSRDYPMVQGAVLILALTRLALNLAADIMYAFVDPRIRFS
jgi:peptide/nickel transport system permease protein